MAGGFNTLINDATKYVRRGINGEITHADNRSHTTGHVIFRPSSQAVVGVLIRRLANGTPISRIEAATLIGCSESDLDPNLARLPFRVELDEQGRIVGAGLTLRPTPHQFVIDGKQLYTIDMLMFAVLLGRTAHVISPCASTGHQVSITVSPEGILAANPPVRLATSGLSQ